MEFNVELEKDADLSLIGWKKGKDILGWKNSISKKYRIEKDQWLLLKKKKKKTVPYGPGNKKLKNTSTN